MELKKILSELELMRAQALEISYKCQTMMESFGRVSKAPRKTGISRAVEKRNAKIFKNAKK